MLPMTQPPPWKYTHTPEPLGLLGMYVRIGMTCPSGDGTLPSVTDASSGSSGGAMRIASNMARASTGLSSWSFGPSIAAMASTSGWTCGCNGDMRRTLGPVPLCALVPECRHRRAQRLLRRGVALRGRGLTLRLRLDHGLALRRLGCGRSTFRRLRRLRRLRLGRRDAEAGRGHGGLGPALARLDRQLVHQLDRAGI